MIVIQEDEHRLILGRQSLTPMENSSWRYMLGARGQAKRRRENRLAELNTNLRSFPPSHAATTDGCVVKHKIECIGNSDVTFHIKAGDPVRQVADRTIDRRAAALEGDARSLESAAARFISALWLRVIHC